MSERSAASASDSAVPGADNTDPPGSAPNENDGSTSATADREASSSPGDVPDGEPPVAGSPGSRGDDRDAGDAAGSGGGGETASDPESAADGRAVPESVTEPDSTAVEAGVPPAVDSETGSAVVQAAEAATVAAAAAAFAASAAATAADAAAEAAAAAAEAAEAAAVAADLAATATRGSPAATDVAGEAETGDDASGDEGSAATTGSEVPGDETFDEAEPQARGIAAWRADRRRDLLAYICVPLVTLIAAPVLVVFWGIVILGSSTDSPAICDGVRAVNGCEELTWLVIRVHVLGFLGLWALLWALPWWRGLRTPRLLLALAAGVFLFVGLLRLAA